VNSLLHNGTRQSIFRFNAPARYTEPLPLLRVRRLLTLQRICSIPFYKPHVCYYPFGGQNPIRQFCLEQNWSNFSSPEGHAPWMAHDSGYSASTGALLPAWIVLETRASCDHLQPRTCILNHVTFSLSSPTFYPTIHLSFLVCISVYATCPILYSVFSHRLSKKYGNFSPVFSPPLLICIMKDLINDPINQTPSSLTPNDNVS
jgi:hypothetical protein